MSDNSAVKQKRVMVSDSDALHYHIRDGIPGKLEIKATKPLVSQRDLARAYSPGVAAPCKAIVENPALAYEYTAKGNFVAVISNGTAVLGLGNLGALASKPVMEGKAVLFKRFADIDGIDIEIDTEDPDEFVNAVRYLGPSWGGINLEDIKAPECFIIEDRLKELMDIPVFHDDQHGTAIITVAGMINAAHITGRSFKNMKIVVNGAGAAGIACLELLKHMGLPNDNAILCDSKGVIYKGRSEGMNQWKSAHAVDTDARSLADAMKGADVFIGLSVKGAVTPAMVKSMAMSPIIFAMANPDPEITPEEVAEVRSDAIVATGRSDYPNQVNNVMGFPYIFRGALDVRAKSINNEMKIAAAKALAELAREPVPDEVSRAYSGKFMKYGKEYIIPTPFDPRLIYTIPLAVAKAALESGVARISVNIDKWLPEYKKKLASRLDPTANYMGLIYDRVKQNPQTVVFAEGEEERIIRSAIAWQNSGYGKSILIGRVDKVRSQMSEIGFADYDIEIVNAANTDKNEEYINYLYKRLQRKGYLQRDIVRLVKNDRNIFGSCMVACGDADVVLTGLTRSYSSSLDSITKVIDQIPNKRLFGISIMIAGGKTILIADTSIIETLNPEEMADIAEQTAQMARILGQEPRVALVSFSNFGNYYKDRSAAVHKAVDLLNDRNVDFEYDGEMSIDVALNEELMSLYPFCRLSKPANILIMPGLHSASISSKLLQEIGGGVMIGPILVGLEHIAQVVPMGANVSEIINIAALASIEAIDKKYKK